MIFGAGEGRLGEVDQQQATADNSKLKRIEQVPPNCFLRPAKKIVAAISNKPLKQIKKISGKDLLWVTHAP